jgi:very-short-patch-repair endonuclease
MSKLVLASDLLANDVTRRELLRSYRKIHRNVYAPDAMELTPQDRAMAAWLWSGRCATASGLSAAALLGSKWVPAGAPAELVRSQHPAPSGIVAHKDTLADDEVMVVDGVSCTTVERTAYDLGRRLHFSQGLAQVDALLNATGTVYSDVARIAVRYPGARNIRRLRDVLAVADGGAESPQESQVRLILIRGGIPRPITQIRIGWRRIDMGWPQYKVGVEYDGMQHWQDPAQHGGDIERLEFFAGLGWRIVRVVAEHVRDNPQGIVHRAEAALRAAGWTGDLMPSRVGLPTPRPGKMRRQPNFRRQLEDGQWRLLGA